MSGPPRKPLPFRKREGNLSGHKLQSEAKMPAGTPERPKHLTGHARKRWDNLIPILSAAQVLTLADLGALEIGCAAYDDWRTARAVVKREGMSYESVSVDDEGNERKIIRPRPEVAIASDAWKRYRAFLSEYGLTAASRSKVAPLHNPGDGEQADFA